MNLKFSKKLSFLREIHKIIAKNSFKAILILFVIALIFGYFIYYKYFFLVINTDPVITEELVDIKQENFQEVLEEWSNREKDFQEANFKNYPNLMKADPSLWTEEED